LGYMFQYSPNFKKIDITHYNIKSQYNSSSICNRCHKLKALIIRSFGDNYVLNNSAFAEAYCMLHQQNSSYNPNGEQGYIYIPRDMIPILSQETNWSAMHFRALEDYIIPNEDGTIDLINGVFDDAKAGIVYETN
jgi:hypothetical protein